MADQTHTRIIIESKQEKSSTKGDPWWIIKNKIDGEFYSIWDKMVEARLRVGDDATVVVETTTKGSATYRNIVGIVAMGDVPAPGTPPSIADIAPSTAVPMAAAPQPAPALPMQQAPLLPTPPTVYTQMTEVRIAGLNAAMQLFAKDVITYQAIESTADKFVNYILDRTV